jgi:hypothetical protein
MSLASIEAIIAAVAGAVKTAVDLGPSVIKVIEDAKPFAQQIIDAIGGKKVTDAQLAQLEAGIQALSDDLQTPLPPDTGT